MTLTEIELLSQSSIELLISLDLVSTKLYCFRAKVHCYYCLYIIFSISPVSCCQELRGGLKVEVKVKLPNLVLNFFGHILNYLKVAQNSFQHIPRLIPHSHQLNMFN